LQSYYEILNIDKSADLKEIKRAYARLLRQHPPETDPEGFQKIREAYDVLSDEVSRESYDKYSDYTHQPDTYTQSQPEDEVSLFYPTWREINESEITEDSELRDVLALSQLSFEQGNYDRCIVILNSALDKTNPSNSKNLLYYMELLKIYSVKDDLGQFTITLNDFFKNMKIDVSYGALDLIFSELKTMAYDMYIDKDFAYSRTLLAKMASIDCDSVDLQYRLRPIHRIDNCREHLEEIEEDVLLCQSIKDIIALWLDENMKRGEKAAKLEEVKAQIQNVDKLLLLKSLNRLKKHYNMFYHIDFDYFAKLHQSTRTLSLSLSRLSAKRIFILKVVFVVSAMALILVVIGAFIFPE
jgi:curved DNA-binding protein CbpA